MDPNALQLQEMISLAGGAGAKYQVSLANGNVVVVPLPQSGPPPPLISDQTSLVTTTAPVAQQSPISHTPTHFPPSHSTLVDSLALNSADEALADLQPEDSEGEEEGERPALTLDQKKLEFMAALNLVPPAVLEEIHRRQQMCKAEYGNWWDRLHSTDFCLVPKNDSALSNIQIMTEEFSQSTAPPQLEVTQVAEQPDTESFVEQITYLTSWPQSNTNEGDTVEVMTTQQPQVVEGSMVMGGGDQGDMVAAAEAQALREHYMTLIADRQQQLPSAEEHSLQAAIQQLANTFTVTH